MATRLFVGNIPTEAKDVDLRKEFCHYGNVTEVELKEKRGPNDVNKFAFITIEADRFNINKCIQEFSEQQWKGNILNVSIAKESFLDRLKRERAEAEKSRPNKVLQVEDKTVVRSEPKKIEIDSSRSSQNFNKFQSEKLDNKNKRKRDEITDVSEAPIEKKKAQKISICQINGNDKPSPVKIEPNKSVNISDKKRLESIQNMKSAYNEKKSLIKMALSGIDNKRNNKIIFDDDDSAKIEDIVSENHVNNSSKSSVKKNKTTLFDDDSEEDGETYNFEIKQQFEGESGRKLLDLQSRYKSDSRFILDERFLEDEKDENDKDEVEAEVSSAENDQNEDINDEIDAINEEEKIRQMEILQGVIGESKVISGKHENSKKLPPKTMLRFDPSRPDHTKFLNKPAEKPTVSKKTKKEKKVEITVQNEKSRPEVTPAPAVSHERYYKINEPLKTSTEEKQPFSLLSLFGNKDIEETESQNEEYSAKPIEKSNKKIKNPIGDEKNPFFYDSSDSENEKDVPKDKKGDDKIQSENKDLPSRPTAVVENFFFSNNDQRLIEGIQFFLNTKTVTERPRHELKSVVKKRIHNNLRNSKFKPKKISKSNKNNNSKKFKRK